MMGWKNIKEHYRIQHIVQVRDGDICIGTGYIHNIIAISQDGKIKKRHERGNEDLSRIQAEMDADPATLCELANLPDTFSESITVYTYSNGDILEKLCEELGWPNVTHDGCLMYENTFSQDKQYILKYAKREAALGMKMYRGLIKEKEQEIQKLRDDLAREKTKLNNLKNIARLEF